MAIKFGDKVRVRTSPITIEAGLAGLVGQVYGETKPSSSGVEVIGDVNVDFALNVFFEDRDKGYWFAPSLIEFVDHSPGMTVELEGVPKRWVRQESGEWLEIPTPSSSSPLQRLTSRFRRNQ